LKDGAFGSNEWRKRNKALSELRQALTAHVKMEESLLDALDVTFKIKPDQRDAFAKLSIEYAEDACKKWGEKLANVIASLDEEGASHKQAIEAAMTTLQEKEKAKELVESDLETEQNIWVDLENATLKMTEASKRDDVLEEATAELADAKEELKEFRDMNSFFATLIDPPAEAEPVAEPEPAAEDPYVAVEAS